MKKLLLLLLLALFAGSNGISQSCLPLGIQFHNQTDIDNFKSNYPGCTEVEGDVLIEEYGLITNLDGLSNILSIGGNLRIIWNYNLNDLTGLTNLTYVGGNLEICYNHSLATMDGLESLAEVDGNLLINSNSSLVDLGGLRALKKIKGNLEIKLNDVLTVLSGIDNITPGTIKNLTIANNPNLSTCEMESICGYLADPKGKVDIYNNKTGCNNPPEIARTGLFDLPCLPYGNYYLYTQEEVDHFNTDYASCNDLKGSLTIRGNLIEDLSGLTDIKKIKGDLVIQQTENLRSLEGFDELDTIKGNLVIENTALNLISGLDELDWIGGSVSIMNNISITSLQNLNKLDKINGDLRIWYNRELTEISGLQELDYVKGMVEIMHNENLASISGLQELDSVKGYLNISANQALTNLNGLENLDKVRGSMVITWSESLTGLIGLQNLASIGGNFQFECNPEVKSFHGMDKLVKIGGSLIIRDNDQLASFTGLHNLKSIQNDLYISDGNPMLDNLSGLEKLSSIGGNLRIHGLPGMVDFNGLYVLATIGGGLLIEDNSSLESLSGLEALRLIGGDLLIEHNSALKTLVGLGKLNQGSVENLRIFNNEELSTCDAEAICAYLAHPLGQVEIYANKSGCNNPGEVAGSCGLASGCLPFGNYYFVTQAEVDNFLFNYPGCVHLQGDVTISGIDITNLYGLDPIKSIRGNLTISENKNLVSLTGLNNLTSVTGSLYVTRNPVLVTLNGLENIEAGSLNYVQVYGNDLLSECAVESVCDFLSIPGSSCYISGNANGCMNVQQVRDMCAFTFITDKQAAIQVSVYPNPATSRVTFVSSQPDFDMEIVLFNNCGQLVNTFVFSGKEMVADISDLPAGVYFYRITSRDSQQNAIGKIVKY